MKKYFIASLFVLISSFASLAQNLNRQSPPPMDFDIHKDRIVGGIKYSIIHMHVCSSTQTVQEQVIEHYKEESAFSGIDYKGKFIYEVYFNPTTQTFTFVEHFTSGNSCVLAIGQGFTKGFDKPSSGPTKISYSIN